MTVVLLRALKESRQSLYAIAKATGVHKTALGRFVAGKQSLRLDIADKLAKHLGLELTQKDR